MGAGTTAVAALRSGRHYVGFETEEAYCSRAEERIAQEVERVAKEGSDATKPFRVDIPAVSPANDAHGGTEDLQARAVREGRMAKELARMVLEDCDFVDIRPDVKFRGLGIELTFVARDHLGDEWAFDVAGAFTASRAGLKRADTLWKALGKAAVLHERGGPPLVLLTTHAPTR